MLLLSYNMLSMHIHPALFIYAQPSKYTISYKNKSLFLRIVAHASEGKASCSSQFVV